MKTFLLSLMMSGLPGLAIASGYTLTTTATSYDTINPRFAGALSGGYGVASLGPSMSSFTLEAWVKLTAAPGQPIVAIGSGVVGYLGASAQGQEVCNVSAGTTSIVGPVITDGNWHLIDLVAGPSGFGCFLDGNSVGSSAVAQNVPANTQFGVGTMGLYAGNNVWSGEIDEASIWNVARYSATFSPPSVPYVGTETGLVALWHLNRNGLDFAADLIVPASDPSILYSPYNWAISQASSTTNNAGAYFRLMFTGNSCAMNFDTSTAAAPFSEIYWRVDGYEAGQPWTRTTPAANIVCTPPADLAAAPWHELEMVVKSTSETINRWNTSAPGTAVRLAGITLGSGAAYQRPLGAPWNILFFGDSITEGVRTINSTAGNDTDRNDATMGWAYRLGQLMGAEVGIVGYGATGLTVGGNGGVPALTSTWNMLAGGVPRPAGTPPSLIVINEGTNDPANVTSAALTVLNGLIALYPDTPIALLVPFNQSHVADLQQAALTCNRPGLVHLVQTGGVLNPANGVDNLLLHPTGPNNEAFVAPRLGSMLTPIMVGGSGGLTLSQMARIP